MTQGRVNAPLSLSLLVAVHRGYIHALHEVVVLGDFGFGHVQVHLHALFEQFRRLGGVAEEQLCHDAVRGHLVEVASAEVEELVVLGSLHVFDSFVVLGVHGLHAGLDGFVFRANVLSFEFFEHLAVGAGGDVREGSNRLQLGRTFVNRSDTGVAVQALASVFEHVSKTSTKTLKTTETIAGSILSFFTEDDLNVTIHSINVKA